MKLELDRAIVAGSVGSISLFWPVEVEFAVVVAAVVVLILMMPLLDFGESNAIVVAIIPRC